MPHPTTDLRWEPDPLLGDGFAQAPLGPATLVRATRRPCGGPRGVVLHVHGYNDYFFQSHLAEVCVDAGLAFYAVDLRRAGRSTRRPGATQRAHAVRSNPSRLPAHYVTSLREPGADLSAAARALRAAEPALPLVVHAHSTGGLTAAVWAHAVRADPWVRPDLLVLDSPFLDLQGSWVSRTARTLALQVLGRTHPLAVVSTGPSVYAEHQHADGGGRWRFDTTLKRPDGLPARAGWLRAVRHAQLAVARGLAIESPVLVARSAASGPDSPGNPHLDAQDTVLDVARIAALAPRLGADVTELVVDGGVHDLTLSADGPRADYLDRMLRWVGDRLAAGVEEAS
ncbi:alpha/beta hydrolase [Isoptericola sp. BMS4]|uniref:alpha/beta hydrolase n=1 Tax=Isoptericola sp. BMS4 TaxID=2527875 RepID=UPI001F0EC98A|nr:alpha/beta hydrolase [Isoptericola sp. BMS4]